MHQPILSLKHVYVSRGGPPVLRDINLTLHSGEHLAILGPNGCGKSTLLKTITCELYPLAHPPPGQKTEGQQTSVSIFGRQRWDLTRLRQRLGFVSADLPGKPTLHTSGFDAILTGFFASSTLWPNLSVTEAMRARAEDLLHEVGAENLRAKPVGEMSAGQQRRIMIARALAGSRAAAALIASEPPQPPPTLAPHPSRHPGQNEGSQHSAHPGTTTPTSSKLEAATQKAPGAASSESLGSAPPPSLPDQDTGEMLLLDEPSNALDLAAQADLRRLLRQLAGKGTAILLITHHTSDIIPEINRVLLMREGEIVADGPKQDLLTAPTLSGLFHTPVNLTCTEGIYYAR